MIALSPKSSYAYVCKAEQEISPELQTTFHLKQLTVSEQASVDDAFGKYVGGDMQVMTGTQHLTALRVGILSVDNLKDSAGATVNVTRTDAGFVSDEFLEKLPKDVRSELARAIIAGARLTETEAQN